jgi:1-aminocyclopropane-1-carboxylate deaminase/D-cysteine desulfhydrase-like pyridoxal-dependent ACC family enzyme
MAVNRAMAAATAQPRPLDSLTVPPRFPLALLPTPLVPAPGLGEALGISRLLVKRDDLTGFAAGGNKARPLEFLLAAAVREAADTLLTGGAPSSAFCAAAAAAAQRAGMACHLVIAGDPVPPGPALALALAWGAGVSWTHDPVRASVDHTLGAAARQLTARGRHPYLIPRGGATALGAAGYALAAYELAQQLAGQAAGRARVVAAVGSGGTMAGLVAGNILLGRAWDLAGASASRSAGEASRRVRALVGECLALLSDGHGPGGPVPAADQVTPGDVQITDVRGPGHGLPSAEGAAVAEQAMRAEGLMVDPVYTAKALSLVARSPGTATVVFWHTGGLLDTVSVAQEPAR